jgi:hypothetical protein
MKQNVKALMGIARVESLLSAKHSLIVCVPFPSLIRQLDVKVSMLDPLCRSSLPVNAKCFTINSEAC